MAQNQTEILNGIYHVLTQIRDRSAASDKKANEKSDKKSDAGTGSISGMFGKSSNKIAKEGAETIKSVLSSLTNFSKSKVNPKKIDATSKAIKGLFDTIIYVGKSKRVIINAMQMLDMLAKSLNTMTQFAKAMSVLLMSVGFSLVAIAGGLALAGVLLGTKSPLGTLGVIVGVLVGIAGAMFLLGKTEKWIEPGIKTSQGMGKAMMYLGGGLVVFVGSLLLISMMLGTGAGQAGMGAAMLTIVGVIAGMSLLFAGIGYLEKWITPGVGVAVSMAIGMGALALGVLVFAGVAKLITGMGTDSKGMPKNDKKTRFGSMMSEIGPGLGTMGIVLVSMGLLFAGLGVLAVAIIPGVIAGLFMAGGMVALALATKKVVKVAGEIGKPEEAQKVITGMVSSVLTGLIDGVSQSLNPGGAKGIKGFATSVKNQVILMNGIAMLMGVSVALSMFAYALTAFANLDNMRVIESYDPKTGKPKFGPTVNIEGVGDTIKKTLVNFLAGSDGTGGLIGATSGLTTRHARAIKAMGKALTGKRGILTAVIQFADVLKTFAQFGPKGQIGYATPKLDASGNPILDGNGDFVMTTGMVKITEVTNNIVDSFTQFATGISNGVKGVGEAQKDKMIALAEVLMGKKRSKIGSWFMSDKPGLLEPINAFSSTLMLYAKFGKDGGVPILDKDGNPTGGSTSMKDIVTNIVTAISTFSDELAKQLSKPGENTKVAQKKMEGYMGLLEQIGTLSVASEGLDKTATSIMSLATSMGALAENLNKLELDKLKVFGEITKQNNSFGGFLNNVFSKDESSDTQIKKEIAAKAATTVATPTAGTTAINQLDTVQLANAIGAAVAASFKNGQFTFQFQDQNRGVLILK